MKIPVVLQISITISATSGRIGWDDERWLPFDWAPVLVDTAALGSVDACQPCDAQFFPGSRKAVKIRRGS